MNENYFTQNLLNKRFPILERLANNNILNIKIDEENGMLNIIGRDLERLNQQDCLELSQLFAILATCFDETTDDENN
jgi:hypothetical protein